VKKSTTKPVSAAALVWHHKKVLKAIDASILKWEGKRKAGVPSDVSLSTLECPLCQMFRWDLQCVGCPVRDVSRRRYCFGTPFLKVEKALTHWSRRPLESEARTVFVNACDGEITFLRRMRDAYMKTHDL
jgi:hypothetical protein